MKKTISDFSYKELDSFLIKKYDLGLNLFASFLRSALSFNPGGGITIYELKNMKERLQNLKKKIESVITETETLWNNEYVWDQVQGEKSKYVFMEVIKRLRANEIFDYIEENLLRINEILTYKNKKKSGAPIKCRNLLITFWGLLLKDKKNRIDWEILADLLDWFWEKLRFHRIYRMLNPADKISDPEYSRNQFIRNKDKISELFNTIKGWDFAGEILGGSAGITVILGEHTHTSLHHSELRSGYDDYFPDSNEAQYFEAILGKIKGLPKEKIPLFGSRGEEINLSYIPFSDLPNIHIKRALIYYAFKLYKAHPDYPPRIIFPDLSYL